MRRLAVFNNISLDGHFVDTGGDTHRAHSWKRDSESNAFAAKNATGEGALLFGRKTHDLMADCSPKPAAAARPKRGHLAPSEGSDGPRYATTGG